ncbi:arginyl-tRNA--protein transferase 1 isoform X2 [Scyliorhinus torazame]|uniref:arginyl-tRNA--protein transferase 1 isoform X2 n=1 Tax=Scyliorhinus torazame TaxID=75743 RepID=UPI003B5B2A5F
MYSTVEYKGLKSDYRCGYCGSDDGKVSAGMWAHTMSVQDYQDLIDRGWRRSGMYVYKPTMNQTCCPQYTIRCHILDVKPSKSSKKALKKMTRFLSKGEVVKGGDVEPMDSHSEDIGIGHQPVACTSEFNIEIEKPLKIVSLEETESTEIQEKPQPDATSGKGEPGQKHPSVGENVSTHSFKRVPKPGKGADPNKPPCRKTKDIRRELKLKKLLQKQQQKEVADVSQEPSCANPHTVPLEHPVPQANQPKSLEEFISESLTPGAAHQLEVRLVRSSPPNSQFKATFQESYQIYKRYQMVIHKDPPDKATEHQVKLVPVSSDDPDFTESFNQSAALYTKYQMAVHQDSPDECSESEYTRFLCQSPLQVNREIESMLKNGIIEVGCSQWSSPIVMVPKPDGTQRLCVDYRKVNAVTRTDSYPIPHLEDCIEKVGQSAFISNFQTWKEHLKHRMEFFNRLQVAGLVMNLAKSEFGEAQITFLEEFPIPSRRREIMRSPSMNEFVRTVVQMFCGVITPLMDLLKKPKKFQWIADFQQAFDCLKAVITNVPVLENCKGLCGQIELNYLILKRNAEE